MQDVKNITNIPDCVLLGKILSNTRKVKMLVELAKGPISKAKIGNILGVKLSTVHDYVVEMMAAGLVEDGPTLSADGKSFIRIVKSKCSGFLIELSKMDDGGWKNAKE